MIDLSFKLVFALFTIIAVAGTPVFGAGATEWKVSPDLEISVLQPGVWLHTSWHVYDGARISSNGLIVRDQDHLVLIDTAWGEEPTEQLLQWIEKEIRLPVTQAIITHAHDDRIAGVPVLARHKIPFSAHAKTVVLAIKKNLPAPKSLGELGIGESVKLGSLEIFYPGPAHAPDNIMVWIASHDLLFGGCAVKAAEAQSLGDIEDANLAEWPKAIRLAQQRYGQAKIVVPGHGHVGGQELLTHTLELLSQKSKQ